MKRGAAVQLGAGGAGGAVACAALSVGVEQLTMFDPDANRANNVVRSLAARFGSERVRVGLDLHAEVKAADGLINATPIGMDPHPGMPVPSNLLRPDLWAADVIYFPAETELLRHARLLGAHSMNVPKGLAERHLHSS